jgi:hypothetical protein
LIPFQRAAHPAVEILVEFLVFKITWFSRLPTGNRPEAQNSSTKV